MGSATEMMVNDFDDERTLDEEEALEGSEDSHNELSNLQKVYLHDICYRHFAHIYMHLSLCNKILIPTILGSSLRKSSP